MEMIGNRGKNINNETWTEARKKKSIEIIVKNTKVMYEIEQKFEVSK